MGHRHSFPLINQFLPFRDRTIDHCGEAYQCHVPGTTNDTTETVVAVLLLLVIVSINVFTLSRSFLPTTSSLHYRQCPSCSSSEIRTSKYKLCRHLFFLFFFCLTFTFQLLDKLWSQVSSLLPPGTCLQFLSRIGFGIPTARRLSSNECC